MRGCELLGGKSISLKHGLLLILLAALLPITIVSIFQGYATWNDMQTSAADRLHANARAIAERERDHFEFTRRLLMVAAANPEIQSSSPQCSDVLRAGFGGFTRIINVVRADANGDVRCSISPFRAGTSFADEAWWQRAAKSNEFIVSQPTIGKVSGKSVIVGALALKNAGGDFVGTVSAGLDISQLEKSIARAPEAQSGYIAVVTGTGNIVVGSNIRIPFAMPARLATTASGTAASASGAQWMFDAVSLSGRDLFVVYAEPSSKIMSAAVAQYRVSMLLPLAAILLASLAIWFGTNRLVIRWLTALREVTDEFTKGNFTDNRQSFANAPAELADLNDGLHDMANVIEGRTKDLTIALQAKTELTREVHHRVKNNLQIVTSLLTMQAARMKDANAQMALQQSRARTAALALIHRLIYEHDAEVERGEVTVEILIGELCKQLRNANRDHERIKLVYTTKNFAVHIDMAVPLALFTVEAVTNSYRHAFSDGRSGKIELHFHCDGPEAVLEIRDDGRGFDVENSIGQDMGSELMQGFAAQLNGTVNFASSPDAGSVITLRFPATWAQAQQMTGRQLTRS